MSNMNEGIEAVRRAREEISREYDNDPRRLVEYYIVLQERHRDRLIDGASQPADTTADASRRS